jgi:Integrase core domain.
VSTNEKKIRAYIVKCDSCVRRKQHCEYKAPLGTLVGASAPFVVCSLDFLSPNPLSQSRNHYLISFIHQLTKYAKLLPVSDQTAATCAKVFVTWIPARHGTPKFVISDIESQFLSEILTETCKLLKDGKIYASGYRPQSNMVEMLHRTLYDSTSYYVDRECVRWDEHRTSQWHTIAPLTLSQGIALII